MKLILSFDPISLEVISRTLEVLDISGNSISSLVPFRCLYQLKKFLASDNNISDVGEIEGIWEVGLKLGDAVYFFILIILSF